MHPDLDVPLVGVVGAYPIALASAAVCAGAVAVWTLGRTTGVAAGRAALAVAGLVGIALLGGRVHYALAHPHVLVDRGLVGAVVLGGRMHLAGGLIACALALPLVARALGVPTARVADGIVPGVATMFGAVRLACLLHGCCFGSPAGWPWCFGYPHGSAPFFHFVETGVLARDAAATMPLHPLPLYFVASGFVLALLAIRRLGRGRFDGETALAMVAGLSLAMAVLEPFRAELPERVYWGPLPQLMWTAAMMSVLAVGALAWTEWRHMRPPSASGSPRDRFPDGRVIS